MSPKSLTRAADPWDHLLARVERLRDSGRVGPDRGPEIDPTTHFATDFSTLPGYQEARLQRQLAERVCVDFPYFRVHDGRAGAQTRMDGRALVNFSSYDYLGLNNDLRVHEAAKAAVDHYGVSASASRHVAGERPVHRKLERALADHYQVEDCAVLVSGYATNLSVIGQLLGPKDLVIYDSAIHNSVLAGAVLSGAARRSFHHNDLDNLDHLLASTRGKFERALIVVEGLYSMDGDYPDLERLIEMKNRNSTWLMVDEAHALGVLGPRGYGSFEHCRIDPRGVDIWMGTLSKTLAGCGGYIAGSQTLVEYVKCMAGAFVYSVGMPPVIAATALRALELLHDEPERVRRVQHNAALFHRLARERGLNVGNDADTAVAPIMIGDSLSAVILSQKLFERGINVQPVIYPAVPAKASRLRFFLTSMHRESDIRSAIDATVDEFSRVPETIRAMRRSEVL